MKHDFMNKENGKIASVLVMYLDDEGHMQTDSYDKVEDLLADYAAYERAPKEPLIKDEKIRKAVRAWAEAFGMAKLEYQYNSEYGSYELTGCVSYDDTQWTTLTFESDGLKGFKEYTIAELCGEEEE